MKIEFYTHTSLKELLLATDSAGIYCIIKYRHNDKLICRENFENGICVEGLNKKQKNKNMYAALVRRIIIINK